MKNLVSYFLLVFIFSCLCVAQTQIWVSQDNPNFMLEDGQGNTYIARTYGCPDSLNNFKKINAQGSVIWEKHISMDNFTMLYNDSGIYISQFEMNFLNDNRVFYYDTSGTLQWTYTMPFSSTTCFGKGQLDNSGNFVFAYDSLPHMDTTVIKIFKLNSRGEKILDARLPHLKFLYTGSSFYLGPFVNSSGNIWIVLSSSSMFYTENKNMSHERQTGYEVAVLIDGITGNILTQKTIFKNLLSDNKFYANGNGYYFSADESPYYNFITYGDDLIGYGTLHTYKATEINFKLNEWEKTNWILARLSPGGTLKLFTYKGSGSSISNNIGGNIHGGKSTTDELGNAIAGIEIGKQNELFVYGIIAKGRNIEGVGNFHLDEILLRLDPNTFKTIWKLSNPRPQIYPTFLRYYQSIQKFIRGVTVNTCNQSLEVVDANGKVSSTKLNFPDCVWLPDFGPKIAFQGPNYEPGMIYMWMGAGGSIAKFDVSSVIAKMDFSRMPSVEQSSNPETFSLNQNYPNPFNPATTIQFELASDALVTVKVYNTLGQEVAVLANREEFTEGMNEMEFDGSLLPSGVYFYRILAEDLETNGTLYTSVKKMILMK